MDRILNSLVGDDYFPVRGDMVWIVQPHPFSKGIKLWISAEILVSHLRQKVA